MYSDGLRSLPKDPARGLLMPVDAPNDPPIALIGCEDNARCLRQHSCTHAASQRSGVVLQTS